MKTRSVEFLESYSVGSAAGSGSPSTGILDQKFADYTDKAIFARIAVSKIDCKRNALSLRGKDHERRHIAFFARGLVDNETLPSFLLTTLFFSVIVLKTTPSQLAGNLRSVAPLEADRHEPAKSRPELTKLLKSDTSKTKTVTTTSHKK